jgi:hypothetical protein
VRWVASVGGDVPGQQVRDAVHGVVGDPGQDLAQIAFGVESVEFCRTNQAVDGGSMLAARVSEPANRSFFRLCRDLHKRKNWIHIASAQARPKGCGDSLGRGEPSATAAFRAKDKVVLRWSATMTHRGDHPGMPASGKRVRMAGIAH